MPETNTATKQKKDNKGIFSRALLLHREKVLTAMPESTFTMAKNVEMEDMTIPISPERDMPARLFRPKKAKLDSELYPTLFYIPGTAFIAYENKFTNAFCSHIAEQSKCQVIILYHALAPEYKFPQGYKDAQALFTYFVKTDPDAYKIDTNKIAISGYSSGGNFAALLAIYAKENNIRFNRQILISPLVDLSRTISRLPQYHALRQYEEKDKAISAEFVAWFLDLYIPPNVDPQRSDISPYFQDAKKIQQLPPTDIILAEYDRFRSDAELYYMKLEDAGVPVEKFIIDKENHAYVWHNLSIVERIKEQLHKAFSKNYVDRPLANTLMYVTAKKPNFAEVNNLLNKQNKHLLKENAVLEPSPCAATQVNHKVNWRLHVLFKQIQPLVEPLPSANKGNNEFIYPDKTLN